MLTITTEANDYFDEETETFIDIKPMTVRLEHSLLSISKWESKYHKSLLSNIEKSGDEMIDYICMMIITQNVNLEHFKLSLTAEILKKITSYMDNPMTATTFSSIVKKKSSVGKQQIITNEVIYSWMFSYSIPKECEKWHISRLLTLIRVCEIHHRGPEKADPRQTAQTYADLNEARLAGGKAG